MKRLLPKSLAGRLMMALVTVIILVNLTSVFFYYLFRDQAAMVGAASQAAEEVIAVTHLLETIPRGEPIDPALPEEERKIKEEERRKQAATQRDSMVQRLSTPSRTITIDEQPIVPESDNAAASRLVLSRVRSRLLNTTTEVRVDSVLDPVGNALPPSSTPRSGIEGTAGPRLSPGAPVDQRFWLRRLLRVRNADRLRFIPGMEEALFRVSIRASQNPPAWINWRVRLAVGEPQSMWLQLLWLTMISVVISVIAFAGVRRAMGRLSVFAAAAERLGVDVNAEPLVEGGPSEVHRAAQAFNTMQMRLKRFIRDRTQMLAAISHDLRTPITRLRLRAEFIDDDVQRRKMLSDLDDMEAMISATLTFARDDAANEPATHVDIAAIVASLCGDQLAAGKPVTYSGPDSFDLIARPLALKRAINNFVDNAVKYGKVAHVSLIPGDDELVIDIDDQGPGIPAGEKERVFAPFTRLETSRSRETGGTGLGLTIARNAIRSMGGDVELINRPQGGLRVKVTLPVPETELLAAAE